MKTLLKITLLAALTMFANAADAPKSALTVAVYDFTGDPDAASYVKNVTTLVTVNLTTETNLVLLERATLTKALQEQALGLSGMVSSDAAAKIGQITGAKVLVAGQVVKTGENHLVLIADIIGTETGRLFVAKVEGAADKLMGLTDELSRKIAQTISDQAANLTAPPQETSAERLERIIKGITGTNRPSVSVSIRTWANAVKVQEKASIESEFGVILLKAGFPVVDANSDRKPEIEITGTASGSDGPRQGDLFSYVEVMDLKVQERRSGRIIALEHQVASATEGSDGAARADAPVNAVDAVAEQILPRIAGQQAPAKFANSAHDSKSPLAVATYDFSGEKNAAPYVNKVTALITAHLAGATNFVMVERAELTAALKEQAFGVSGMVSPDAAAQIGRITGAKVLVAGQVMKIGDDHLILVANIVGTESGRLFADKVEGAADNLPGLTDELSRRIAQTISLQTTNLTTTAQETGAERLDRIIKNLPGTNRPTVSVHMTFHLRNKTSESDTTETMLGAILLKAGFPVADDKSERKPDIQITGTELASPGPRQGDLYSCTDPVDIKVQDRRTGNILAVEHQVGAATDVAQWAASMASELNGVDAVAEKVLPLLSNQHYEP